MFLARVAVAALVFAPEMLPLRGTPTTRQLTGKFTFVNQGNTRIAIKSVQGDCLCTSARTDKPSYAPGERGVLFVKVNASSMRGTKVHLLTVTTNEPGAAPYVLPIKCSIPENVAFSRQLVSWPNPAAIKPEAVLIRSLTNDPIKVVSTITAIDDFVSARVSEKIPGKEYLLQVTPKSKTPPFDDQIDLLISTTSRSPQSQTVTKGYTVFIRADQGDAPAKARRKPSPPPS